MEFVLIIFFTKMFEKHDIKTINLHSKYVLCVHSKTKVSLE